MADQLIMYPIVAAAFAYLAFSLFYIRAKYSKKRSDRNLDMIKKNKIDWMKVL
jgi:uncharacterized membrane protein YciS (DUF1049 family)